MCVNPGKVTGPDGKAYTVGCRVCWQCKQVRVDDWVGRCIAERKTAVGAHFVTLTYGADRQIGDIDNIRAAVLTYSDIRKFLAYLRVEGFPVRFFTVGEYGSAKGRAHWHILLFWQDKVPDVEVRKNFFMSKYWQHGWSYWDDLSPETVRYCCKYLAKDMADDQTQYYGPRMSKKPPLGDAYFRDLAHRYVAQGLAPRDLYYGWSDVRRSDGSPVRFLMQGKTADNFLDYYLERLTGKARPAKPVRQNDDELNRAAWRVYHREMLAWVHAVSNARGSNSELVEEYLDRVAAPLLEVNKARQMVEDMTLAERRRRFFDPVYGPGFNLHWRSGDGSKEA